MSKRDGGWIGSIVSSSSSSSTNQTNDITQQHLTHHHNNNTNRGDGSSRDRSTAAVDAHYGASVTLSYFKDVHGRNGVDGRGAKVQSRVHLSKAYDNAYCERQQQQQHVWLCCVAFDVLMVLVAC